MEISQERLTHLKQLEAESMHIMREVIAEFQNPAMLYSVGKDSSVMLHILQKAFYPAPPPLPLVHVDTKWKFKEMIDFRDRRAKEVGIRKSIGSNRIELIAQFLGESLFIATIAFTLAILMTLAVLPAYNNRFS